MDGDFMMIWLVITNSERDRLRLFQQTHWPGEKWNPPAEPETKWRLHTTVNVEVEINAELEKQMKQKPNTTAEARA
jgi:hypothetical protein